MHADQRLEAAVLRVLRQSAEPLTTGQIRQRLGMIDKSGLERVLFRAPHVHQAEAGPPSRWTLVAPPNERQTPLPAQSAQRPPVAIANTMTNTGLAKLTRDVVGWPQFYSALNAELRQAEFDHIAVRRLDDTARMHVRQVIDDVPLLVAYQVVAARHLVHAAVRQTWHAWPIEHALRYDTTTLADLAAAQEGPWVISWRAPDNLSLARAITTCLMTRAGETRGVRVELEPMSAQRLIARRAIIADIERRRRALNKPGWTGWKNPVAGACLLCGRPLRDPESVFRGIGPDCWETFRGAGLTLDLRETRTDISPERWASALTMQTFRALLVDDLHQDLR